MSEEYIELMDLPKNTVNNSAVGGMVRCGAVYEFSQVRKIKQRGSSALILGSGVHGGEDYANAAVAGGESRPSVEKIQAKFREVLPLELVKTQNRSGLEIEWKEHEDESVDTMERLIDDGVKMLATYEGEIGCRLEPVFSEKGFTLKFKDLEWVFNGRIDFGTRAGAIVDLKTSGKSKPKITPFIDVQLTDYNIAVEYGDDEIQLLMPAVTAVEQHVLIRPSKKFPDGRTQILTAPARTIETMQARLGNIATVVAQIRAGYFPRVESWPTCSWCGYLETCNPFWYDVSKVIKAERKAEKAAAKAEKAAAKESKPAAAASRGRKR